MGKNPFGIGIEKEKNEEDNFKTSLFYFMKEFHINPLNPDERITIPLFNTMMKEMQEHYKRENEDMKKANRKR